MIFVGKAGSLASPENIRLGWKGLPDTNALAYYEKCSFTSVKTFNNSVPGRRIEVNLCQINKPISQSD
jgi:hypothetical protein